MYEEQDNPKTQDQDVTVPNIERVKTKNWRNRVYYVTNTTTNEIEADMMSSEKECREWIRSIDSKFDVPYMISYRVDGVNTTTKTQKTVLK
ncbi:MAG: hypothetical protein RBT65_12530 [Methanolobus sp.]|nr:hypothetical protein [Methanolobus sp.]